MAKHLLRGLGWWCLLICMSGWAESARAESQPQPVSMLVMDPLCTQLACDCVEGYAQRDYKQLASFLGQRIGRPMKVTFDVSLVAAMQGRSGKPFDIVIGKQSVVLSDAERVGRKLIPLAMLSGKDGSTNLHGLFIVRHNDPAQTIEDLVGRKIQFGPADSAEKHAAALAVLKHAGVPIPQKKMTGDSCADGALDVVEGKVDAAVISSYAKPLLIGCGSIEAGSIRVIGQTASLPFITLFADAHLSTENRQDIGNTLVDVKDDATLCKALETRLGFIAFHDAGDTSNADGLISPRPGWTQFLGAQRNGHSPDVPDRLPDTATFAWQQPLDGQSMAGIAANDRYVIVADKSSDQMVDTFHALDADTGQTIWKLTYPASGEMDFGNSPRATPVIDSGRVYLLGAFGQLHCVDLHTGQVLWQINLAERFNAPIPKWGFCATPLIAAEKLIVNPGGPNAALVALHKETGKVLWQTPGKPANYASPVLARLGGVDQIVLYDHYRFEKQSSLAGHALSDGRELWRSLADDENYYVVPTPAVWNGRLITATEMLGVQVRGFHDNGRIVGAPAATSDAIYPTCTSPLVTGNRLINFDNRLVCQKLDDGLKVAWENDELTDADHVSMIAGSKHLLVCTVEGNLALLDITGDRCRVVDRLSLFSGNSKTQMWSHPALVGHRLYLRANGHLHCLDLSR